MGQRRKAREYALQILFQFEFDEYADERKEKTFWRDRRASHDVKEYSRRLTSGVQSYKEEIDSFISSVSVNWRLSRMAIVDRNILRIAVFELLYEKETAAAVVINEAIEIAKKFGSEEAPSFINGVLDAVVKKIGGPRKKNEEKKNGG
ncbi:MAG: transcription antitermination factor NusB [Candidatus Aminicenantes bacterium]|nr:transcription antitermination factor NusB [Candidatus Aminicenantes bacterium]